MFGSFCVSGGHVCYFRRQTSSWHTSECFFFSLRLFLFLDVGLEEISLGETIFPLCEKTLWFCHGFQNYFCYLLRGIRMSFRSLEFVRAHWFIFTKKSSYISPSSQQFQPLYLFRSCLVFVLWVTVTVFSMKAQGVVWLRVAGEAFELCACARVGVSSAVLLALANWESIYCVSRVGARFQVRPHTSVG